MRKRTSPLAVTIDVIATLAMFATGYFGIIAVALMEQAR